MALTWMTNWQNHTFSGSNALLVSDGSAIYCCDLAGIDADAAIARFARTYDLGQHNEDFAGQSQPIDCRAELYVVDGAGKIPSKPANTINFSIVWNGQTKKPEVA